MGKSKRSREVATAADSTVVALADPIDTSSAYNTNSSDVDENDDHKVVKRLKKDKKDKKDKKEKKRSRDSSTKEDKNADKKKSKQSTDSNMDDVVVTPDNMNKSMDATIAIPGTVSSHTATSTITTSTIKTTTITATVSSSPSSSSPSSPATTTTTTMSAVSLRKQKQRQQKSKKGSKIPEEDLLLADLVEIHTKRLETVSTDTSATSSNVDSPMPMSPATGSVVVAPTLTRDEKRKLKKMKREFARKSGGTDGQPAFMVSKSYEQISLKDLRDLVVYILTETPALPWIIVRNKFNIRKVVFLYVSGLDPQFFKIDPMTDEAKGPVAWSEQHLEGPSQELTYLQKAFDYMHVTRAGGDKQKIFSPTATLLNVPLSNSERFKREQGRQKKTVEVAKKPEYYMLTLADLQESDFPLPTYLQPASAHATVPKGWIETPVLPKTTLTPPPKKLIALDCEMCRTAEGSELTRVTLIGDSGKVIYDELVMPKNPILDYLTQYSGMTAARLEGVTTTLEDVQKKLTELIDYNTILIGHSLENDLRVMKLMHPFIIDTSKIYHHTRGPPYRPGLKWLAQKWLKRDIQVAGERGHDSAEDALACMDLLKLKLIKGTEFGEYNQEHESLFSRLQRFSIPRKCAVVDADGFSGQAATTTVKASSDQEVVEAVPGLVDQHDFVWARLRDLELNHGKTPEVTLALGQMIDTGRSAKISSRDKVQASEEEIREAAKSVDESLKKIISSLPSGTAIVVASGQGDHREVSRMQDRQKKFLELFKTKNLSDMTDQDKFLEKDVEALEEAVNVARCGICFLMVKS